MNRKADASLYLVFGLTILGIALFAYFDLCGSLLHAAIISLGIALICGLIFFSQIHYAGFLVSFPVFTFLMIVFFIMQHFSLCQKFL